MLEVACYYSHNQFLLLISWLELTWDETNKLRELQPLLLV